VSARRARDVYRVGLDLRGRRVDVTATAALRSSS
jgi:hypothetical protein